MRWIMAGFSGMVFSLGLGIAGMTQPEKIVGFLDVTGRWDPSLLFVMGGALGVHGLTRLFVLKRIKPVFAEDFPTHPRAMPDRRLVGGAALFGVGWGIAGYCPGPAFTSLASESNSSVLLFVLAMLGGMGLFSLFARKATASSASPCRSPSV